MRIISGKFARYKLNLGNNLSCKPTLGRMRKTCFDILYSMKLNFNEHSRFLDAFGGTGIMGLEAHSIFNIQVTYVEYNIDLLKIFKKNIQKLNINFDLIHGNILALIKRFKHKYNIIFLDPPYHQGKILQKTIDLIDKYNILLPKGILIIECSKFLTPLSLNVNLSLIKTIIVGNTQLLIYSKD